MIMDRKQFEDFLRSLEPMKSPADTAVRRNYRKVLDAGFRDSRKEHCYVHPDGYKITPFRKGVMKWHEIK